MNDIKAALVPIGPKHGITIKTGNISYDNNHFTTKITVLIGDGEALEREIWNNNARFLSIPVNWFGKEFINRDGKVCKVDGINPKAHKMPIKFTEVVSGKKMKCAASVLIAAMNLEVNQKVNAEP